MTDIGIGIVAFIRARLDDEEQGAREAAADGPEWQFREGAIYPSDTMSHPGALAAHPHGDLDRVHGEHIARHDPARALRRVEAYRGIFEMHGELNDGTGDTGLCGECYEEYPCTTWRLLAMTWDDHPDYDESWRP